MDKKEDIEKRKNELDDNSIIEIEQLISDSEKDVLVLKKYVEELKIKKGVQLSSL